LSSWIRIQAAKIVEERENIKKFSDPDPFFPVWIQDPDPDPYQNYMDPVLANDIKVQL